MDAVAHVKAVAANSTEVLSVPKGEMLIFAASLIAFAALIYVVITALRDKIPASRALLAVVVAILVPVIGPVLVVWAVATETRRGSPSSDQLVVNGSAPHA